MFIGGEEIRRTSDTLSANTRKELVSYQPSICEQIYDMFVVEGGTGDYNVAGH